MTWKRWNQQGREGRLECVQRLSSQIMVVPFIRIESSGRFADGGVFIREDEFYFGQIVFWGIK